MVRDILNMKSGENIMYEYLSENLMTVTGENPYSDVDEEGGSFLSFETGPTFKIGRVSSFRGLDKEVTHIRKVSERNGLFTYQMELEDANR